MKMFNILKVFFITIFLYSINKAANIKNTDQTTSQIQAQSVAQVLTSPTPVTQTQVSNTTIDPSTQLAATPQTKFPAKAFEIQKTEQTLAVSTSPMDIIKPGDYLVKQQQVANGWEITLIRDGVQIKILSTTAFNPEIPNPTTSQSAPAQSGPAEMDPSMIAGLAAAGGLLLGAGAGMAGGYALTKKLDANAAEKEAEAQKEKAAQKEVDAVAARTRSNNPREAIARSTQSNMGLSEIIDENEFSQAGNSIPFDSADKPTAQSLVPRQAGSVQIGTPITESDSQDSPQAGIPVKTNYENTFATELKRQGTTPAMAPEISAPPVEPSASPLTRSWGRSPRGMVGRGVMDPLEAETLPQTTVFENSTGPKRQAQIRPSRPSELTDESINQRSPDRLSSQQFQANADASSKKRAAAIRAARSSGQLSEAPARLGTRSSRTK